MLSPVDYANHHLQILNNYLVEITGRTILCGELERLAVERFIKLKQDFTFNEPAVVRVLKFFSLINVPINGQVKQFELLDYMVFWLANVYGLEREPGKRLFNTAYIELAKKNAKTTVWAIAGLYEALCDGELNANCIYIAGARDQAKIALSMVEDAIRNSPAIKKKFKITRNIITNQTATGKNVIQIKSAEAKTIQGPGTSYSLCDEVAVYESSEIVDKVKSGMVARKNPLQVMITTAANNLQSPAKTMRDLCEEILRGKIENTDIFTQIFSFDSKDEVEQLPNNWNLFRKCSPGLGKCVNLDTLQSEYRLGKMLKSKWQTFLTDNCNLWINDNITEETFIDDDTIVSCMTTERIPTGETSTYYGIDLSRNKDLGSISKLHESNGVFHFEVSTIFPNNHSNKIREFGSIDLSQWFIRPGNEKGYIHTSKLPVLDEQIIFDLFKGWKQQHKINRVGFDPHLASQIMYRLEKELALNCVHIKQNWTLTQPISFFERLVHLGKVKIVRNPVVRWNFQNAALQISPGMNSTMRLTKRNKEAIDCVISIIISLSAWMIDNQHKYNDVMSMFEELKNVNPKLLY
jgi:phage terminase large subunit-like protein